jgi:membrane protease YdiL (CAAX protease family)
MIRGIVLVLGGAVIIGSLLFTVMHFTDRVVFTVLVPGVIVGLMLVGVYVGIGKRGSNEER